MKKCKKHFEYMSDIGSELMSQMFVIEYIKTNYYLEYRKVCKILDISYEPDEIFDNNENFIELIENAIDEKIEEKYTKSSQYIPYPKWLNDIDTRSKLGELISYIQEFLEINSIDILAIDTKETLFTDIKNDIEQLLSSIPDEQLEYSEYSDEEINNAILAVEWIKNNNLVNEYEKIETTLLDFKTTLRLLDNYSMSNIYRQAFINIFSIFDAIVFDTLVEYFRNNIKELESFFGSKNNLKFSFEDISKHDDLSSLYLEMVEKSFKDRYLSNIIKSIGEYKKDFFDSSFKLCDMLEAVNRRNLHIHKKGIVDDKYLSEGNIYNLEKGKYAYIDSGYYIDFFNLISKFDDKLTSYFK